MTEKVYRSKCCKVEVRVYGVSDFLGNRKVGTVNYVCLKCNKPCDVVTLRGQKRKMRAAEESKEWLDFQGKMLQKLVEFFDGITIHPVKGVILTSKKKRQLAELKEMDWTRNIFKKRIKKPHK